MGIVQDGEQVHPEARAQWRAWLLEHADRGTGVWLVQWKPRTGRPAVDYEAAVEEALCVGWVDSTSRSLDDERSALWFAPRRPGSGWARTNKARIARLEAAGLLAEAGRAAVDRAKADASWTLLDGPEALEVPDDLAAALAEHPGALDRWLALPRTPRRAALVWIAEAKRPETRATRVARTAELTARGERPR